MSVKTLLTVTIILAKLGKFRTSFFLSVFNCILSFSATQCKSSAMEEPETQFQNSLAIEKTFLHRDKLENLNISKRKHNTEQTIH